MPNVRVPPDHVYAVDAPPVGGDIAVFFVFFNHKAWCRRGGDDGVWSGLMGERVMHFPFLNHSSLFAKSGRRREVLMKACPQY